MKPYFKIFTITAAVLFLLNGCAKKEETRTYTEIVIDSPLRAPDAKGFTHPPVDGMSMPGIEMHGNDMSRTEMSGLKVSHADVPLSWQVPSGWSESKGEGMRLVSFHSADAAHPIDCSIVSLGGVAGGVKANIVRWMGQLKLSTPSDEELDALLSKQPKFTSKGKLSGIVIDFAQLQADQDDQADSMLSAIIELPQNVVFVKMTGSKAAIRANKEQFQKLYQSLRLNSK